MRRLFAALLPLLAACGQDSAPAQARRGHEVFESTARAFAAGLFAETRAKDPAAADALLKASGAADDAAFAEIAARETLVRYGLVLALTEERAADFRAGRFDDPGNRARVSEYAAALEKNKIPLPEISRYAYERARSGAATGLELEFAARVLWAETARPR